MRVVTTCHKAGFEQYGFRWIEGIKNWPTEASFFLYAEGFDPPEGVNGKRIEDLPRLRDFKARHADYVPPSWEFDIVRYSNKVFAAFDAFYDYDGLCVWLDADCVTFRPISELFIRSLLPEGHYMSLFRRVGLHTETGLWMQDGSHPEHRAFWDTWIQWFETDEFKRLRGWHDCTTLDATVALFEKDGRAKFHNLSGKFAKEGHPMAKVELGQYIDHCKGPRKATGFSPENANHKVLCTR